MALHFSNYNVGYIRHFIQFVAALGVTLAQLVKASVGQADVQRFKPHLGHNWLSCGVFLVKSRHFGLPLAQTIMPKVAISLSRWLGRYTNVEYLQSLYLKRRHQKAYTFHGSNSLSHLGSISCKAHCHSALSHLHSCWNLPGCLCAWVVTI